MSAAPSTPLTNGAKQLKPSDGATSAPKAGPTAPFRGLHLIPLLSIKGADEYERLAAEPVVYTWDGIAMQGIVVG